MSQMTTTCGIYRGVRQSVGEMVLAGLCFTMVWGATGASPASAQGQPELRLCPTTIVHTCVIGYVSAPNRIVIMLSSKDNDPLVGGEVEVAATPPNAASSMLDMSMHLGSVVMLDAIDADRLYAAKLVSVADPLLTALYLSMYMQPMPAGVPPR